ncbi:GhoT/OrtT family toxin [Escherichia coli]
MSLSTDPVFYAVMAAIAFLSPGFFLTIRNASVLSAFLVGATWPMSFPVALLFSLF